MNSMTTLERRTLDFWLVSKTFYNSDESEAKFTVEMGLQDLGRIIGDIGNRKKVWGRCTKLQDNIICNNKEAK